MRDKLRSRVRSQRETGVGERGAGWDDRSKYKWLIAAGTLLIHHPGYGPCLARDIRYALSTTRTVMGEKSIYLH